MHWCLTIVEIQHAIFREIQADYRGEGCLAKLARTRRTFNNVALDILWETLPSIRYLVQCLPQNLWKITGRRANGEIKFQRTMSRSDWKTFFKYSPRIRSLSDLDYRQATLSLNINVIIALSRPPGCSSPVPNLKALHWKESDEKYAPLLQSLLVGSLVDLQLPSFALQSPKMSMDLITGCPLLKRLSIGGGQISTETLVHLHLLESLECHVPDETAIINLAQFSSLVELSVQLPRDLRLDKPIPYPMSPAFTSLRSLELEVDNPSTLTLLVKGVHFRPQKVSFTFTSKESAASGVFRRLFTALVDACDSERLSSVSLYKKWHPDYTRREFDRPWLSLSTFKPLLVLRNMEEFSFDDMCKISLDDDALDTLTKHWPKLTDLCLNEIYGWGIPSRVTHKGLITLLSRCTSLTAFSLAVDFEYVECSPSFVRKLRTGNKITSHCRYANFITSEIQDPDPIASFISHICPKLDQLMFFWGDEREALEMEVYDTVFDDCRSEWEEVGKLLGLKYYNLGN